MTAPRDLRDEVHRLVRRHAPGGTSGTPLADDLPLTDGGLGLDSVGLVELLLACEDLFGVGLAAAMLADAPLTVGKLVAHARRRRAEASASGAS